MGKRSPLSRREIKAIAFHLADIITTKAEEIARRDGLPLARARDRAIAEMAGE